MRAKKLLALALAGMALTTCLSGCNRTIIEHQFHTNTVTDTEYIETIVDSGLVSGVEKLANLFMEHGIMVYFYYLIGNSDGISPLPPEEELNVSPSPEQVDDFYADPDILTSALKATVECKDEHWMSAWSDSAELIYQAIVLAVEEGRWDWDEFKTTWDSVTITLHEIGDEEMGQRQAIRTMLTVY